MGNFYPDTGKADHDGAGGQMQEGGIFLQGFKVARQLLYEWIEDIQ